MKAILLQTPGDADQLFIGTRSDPQPAADELLVRVHATALNRADILQREGKYPPPPGASDILGLEMAGVVERVGPACEGWAVGDAVCALLPGGGYAERVAVPYQLALHVPGGLTLEQAAAIPEVFLTAYQALHWIGGLREGWNVLIHAGASGVGTAAIQLARAAGATPYVTASASKLPTCRALGAAYGIDYRTEDFAERMRALTGGHGADLILDFVGAPYLSRNLEVLALDGRLVLLATLGGGTVERFDLRALFKRRAQVTATTLRNRSLSYKIALTAAFAEDVLPLLAAGTVAPVIDSTYDWHDVAEAHRWMEANLNVGKIVLRIT